MLVAVYIQRIPSNLRNKDCVDAQSENIKEAIEELIRSKDGPTELRTSISPEPLSPGPSGTANVPGEDVPAKERDKPISQPALEDDTDDEIWAGKRTNVRKIQDLAASTALVEAVKEYWNDIANKKISRIIVFGKVANLVRSKGIRITRNKEKAWDRVYQKWRKLKETYVAFVDGTKQTGKGAEKLPPLYNELNELLGNRDISRPQALSSSLPSGPKLADESNTMTDRRREFETIRRENAEMAAMGFGEDINEEMEMGPSEPEPKKKKLSSDLLVKIVTNLDELQNMEKRKVELLQKRNAKRDELMEKRDRLQQENEERKIAISSKILVVLNLVVEKKKKKSKKGKKEKLSKKRKRQESSSSSSSSSSQN